MKLMNVGRKGEGGGQLRMMREVLYQIKNFITISNVGSNGCICFNYTSYY